MVIFGAGASYDSCSSVPLAVPPAIPQRYKVWHRPPLARELFLPIPKFRAISKTFSRLQPLLPYLETKENIEETLERFRAEAENDTERRSQLLAIRYYLKDVIGSCEDEWTRHTFGASNYKTLLDQVRGYPRVCFVTFNYDTLMERALAAIDSPVPKINDYIRHSRSLIKLHGSIDWWQWFPKLSTTGMMQYNEQPTPQDMIRAAPIVEDICIICKQGTEPPEAKREIYFSLPALAIPTVSKQTFVCPPEHIQALRNLIPDVTKIVIVGWRAGEKHFPKMLKDGLTKTVPVIAACGDADSRAETFTRMEQAGINIHFDRHAEPEGFTDFVKNRRIEPFLTLGAHPAT